MAPRDPRLSVNDLHWATHGVQAQNYHIFTPALDKDWCMAWSSATWIKEFPYANAVCKYNFKPGEAGNLIEELYITPFDYAGPEGPQRAVESVLSENKIIGLSFAVIDYRDPNSEKRSFWNLSRHTRCSVTRRICARSSSCPWSRNSRRRSMRNTPSRWWTWTAAWLRSRMFPWAR